MAYLITISNLQTHRVVLGSVLRIPQNPLGTKEVHINFPERSFIRPAYLIQTHKYIWAFWPDHLTFDATVMVCLTEPKHTAWTVPWAVCVFSKIHTHRVTETHTYEHAYACAHTHTQAQYVIRALTFWDRGSALSADGNAHSITVVCVCMWNGDSMCIYVHATESVSAETSIPLWQTSLTAHISTHTHTHENTHKYKCARVERWFGKDFSRPECHELHWVNTD